MSRRKQTPKMEPKLPDGMQKCPNCKGWGELWFVGCTGYDSAECKRCWGSGFIAVESKTSPDTPQTEVTE